MSKGLKELEHLFDIICSECKHKFYKNGNKCSYQCNVPETVKNIEKELKAFEIIKPLIRFEVDSPIDYVTLYYIVIGKEKFEITRKQFDLLREVLKDE